MSVKLNRGRCHTGKTSILRRIAVQSAMDDLRRAMAEIEGLAHRGSRLDRADVHKMADMVQTIAVFLDLLQEISQ